MRTMRPAIIIVIAVLIAAVLLVFDGYEYDGHYRMAVWDTAKQQIDQLEDEVETWLGNDHR